MTRIAGYELIASPCCRKIYAQARFSSVNFSASAFWTDGKRENSLMPNDGGLRKCECGTFFMMSECTTTGLDAGDKPFFAKHLHDSDLPLAIQSASSQKVELAARRAYWMHLNEGYRGLYIAHRAAEQEATELKWVSDWHRANPDKRNSFKRFIDKLLFRTQPIAPPAPQAPITFPSFEPTEIQRKNMIRLAELVESQSEDYVKEYPIELAELYRELGMFDKASSLINGIKIENQDVVTNLILDLCNKKTSAPVRYRY